MNDSHVWFLHGTFNLNGEKTYEVCHGSGTPLLLEGNELESADIGHAWFDDQPSAPPQKLVRVGRSEVTFTPSMFNFGIIPATAGKSSSVTVRNVGPLPVELGSIDASCACTSAGFSGGINQLDPGQSVTLKAEVSPQARHSIRKSLKLTLREAVTGEVANARLEMIGCKYPTKRVSVEQIFLGSVRQGGTLTTSFHIAEVATDRFEIDRLTVDLLPIEYSIASRSGLYGLKVFTTTLSCDTASLTPGTHRGLVQVRTTSPVEAMVQVPVSLRVLPDVQIHPATLSFKATPHGDPSTARATIVAGPGTEVTSARVLNVGHDLTVSIGAAVAEKIPIEVRWLKSALHDHHTLLFVVQTSHGPASLKLECR